jgi:hypothetical protein
LSCRVEVTLLLLLLLLLHPGVEIGSVGVHFDSLGSFSYSILHCMVQWSLFGGTGDARLV